MYRAFNVILNRTDLSRYTGLSDDYRKQKAEKERILKNIVDSGEKISAEEIKKSLLPETPFDVFISHSHNDLNLACKLKSFLNNEFGLTAFVDSLYWGNIDSLQDALDARHYNAERNVYNRNKSLYVSRHVNVILASALTEMIDNCECVFFLNTENSVPDRNSVLSGVATYSPWIYHEVFTASVIRRKTPARPRSVYENRNDLKFSLKDGLPDISYGLNLKNMATLDADGLLLWDKKYFMEQYSGRGGKQRHPLDILYSFRPEPQ